MKIAKALLLGLLSISLLTFTACSDDNGNVNNNQNTQNPNNPNPEGPTEAEKTQLKNVYPKVLETYAKIAYNSYSDSLAKAKILQKKINAFTNKPTEDTLREAKEAWLASRPEYLQTEVFRFYDGPINNFTGTDKRYEDGGDVEGYINAWPLDEKYIDYGVKVDEVDGKPKFTTVIDDDAFKKSLIYKSTLTQLEDPKYIRGLNGKLTDEQDKELKTEDAKTEQAETNVATGYHAIEFMLWGQDLDADGPGNRPVEDYTTKPEAEKRKAYLNTIAQILVEDLQWVTDQWAPATKDKPGSYLNGFLAEPETSFVKILGGMKQLTLDETGGERVLAALKSGSQEEEHSCFSDNTHIDMIEDVQGILNVWNGSYDGTTKVPQGTGIKEAIKIVSEDDATKLSDELKVALDDAKKLVDLNDPDQKSFDKLLDKVKNAKGYARLWDFAKAMYNTKDTYKDIYSKLNAKSPGEADLDWGNVTK